MMKRRRNFDNWKRQMETQLAIARRVNEEKNKQLDSLKKNDPQAHHNFLLKEIRRQLAAINGKLRHQQAFLQELEKGLADFCQKRGLSIEGAPELAEALKQQQNTRESEARERRS